METTKTFSIKEALSSGWQNFKKYWSFLVPALLLTILVNFGLSLIAGELESGLVSSIVQIIAWVVSILINLGWLTISLNIVKGKEPAWRNFIDSAQLSWKIIMATLLFAIIVYIGMILLIIPGIYFAIKYQYFALSLIENPDLGIWASFKRSASLTKGVKWKLFGFGWVSLGVSILGLLALGVGALVAWIVLSIATAFIYVTLAKQVDSVQDTDEASEPEAVDTHVAAESTDMADEFESNESIDDSEETKEM
jgi:uncharacterized membrane protein